VRSLAFHLLRDDADADDAAQETLARALATKRRPDETRPWLAGVLRNVVRRSSRDRVRRALREARVARPEALPAAADFVAREQILRRVADAVLALDEPQRVVVLLRHYEGLPPREIAARLGTPIETVKSRLKRAHDRLRETLDEGRRGNVEGWRSALGGLVGLAPDGTPLAGGIVGDLAGTGTGRAAGAAAKGGGIVASKTVVVAAVAAFVLVLGGVLVWKAPWRSRNDRGTPTTASRETVRGATNDHAPALAVPPQPIGGMGASASGPADTSAPPGPAAPPAGPAAGWKRWAVGSIRIDIPENWNSNDNAFATDQRSWSTQERPWPDATFRLDRAASAGHAPLLNDSDVVSSEQVQIAGETVDLRILEPKKGPPGVNLRALVVVIQAPFGEGRPLSFFAASTKEKFAEYEPTYRAILASVRATASASASGEEFPSAATLHAHDVETPLGVLEGVVILGDSPFPGGQARLRIGAQTRATEIGADGRFRFDSIGTGMAARLEVEPAGATPREISASSVAGSLNSRRRLIVALGHSSIEGRVFDREGRPVARGAVRALWNGRRQDAYAESVVVAMPATDGSYRVSHLLPGRYEVIAAFDDGNFKSSLVEISGTTPTPCDLGSPTPEPTLSGFVRGPGVTTPGPGSLIFVGTKPGVADMATASYDADGRYSARMPTGTYLVRVQPPAPARSILLDEPVIVPPGVSTRDLVLPDGRIRGRLVNPATRRPVERASTGREPWQVCLQRVAASVINSDLCAEVADDGTFQFEYVPPGKYTVVCTAPLAPGPDGKPRVIEVLGGGATTDVELELLAK